MKSEIQNGIHPTDSVWWDEENNIVKNAENIPNIKTKYGLLIDYRFAVQPHQRNISNSLRLLYATMASMSRSWIPLLRPVLM